MSITLRIIMFIVITCAYVYLSYRAIKAVLKSQFMYSRISEWTSAPPVHLYERSVFHSILSGLRCFILFLRMLQIGAIILIILQAAVLMAALPPEVIDFIHQWVPMEDSIEIVARAIAWVILDVSVGSLVACLHYNFHFSVLVSVADIILVVLLRNYPQISLVRMVVMFYINMWFSRKYAVHV